MSPKWKSKWSAGCQGSDVACQINEDTKRGISCDLAKKVWKNNNIDRPCLCVEERQIKHVKVCVLGDRLACGWARAEQITEQKRVCVFIYMRERVMMKLYQGYFCLYDYLLGA